MKIPDNLDLAHGKEDPIYTRARECLYRRFRSHYLAEEDERGLHIYVPGCGIDESIGVALRRARGTYVDARKDAVEWLPKILRNRAPDHRATVIRDDAYDFVPDPVDVLCLESPGFNVAPLLRHVKPGRFAVCSNNEDARVFDQIHGHADFRFRGVIHEELLHKAVDRTLRLLLGAVGRRCTKTLSTGKILVEEKLEELSAYARPATTHEEIGTSLDCYHEEGEIAALRARDRVAYLRILQTYCPHIVPKCKTTEAQSLYVFQKTGHKA